MALLALIKQQVVALTAVNVLQIFMAKIVPTKLHLRHVIHQTLIQHHVLHGKHLASVVSLTLII
jgi:hypothetical protein